MSEVKRWDCIVCQEKYVIASDYDALSQRVAELTAEVMHYTAGTPHPDTADAARWRVLSTQMLYLIDDNATADDLTQAVDHFRLQIADHGSQS